jgi:beta-glucanase (GH16 family)
MAELKTATGQTLDLQNASGVEYRLLHGLDDPDMPITLVDPATGAGTQPMGTSGSLQLTLSEEFTRTMRVVDAATGLVKFRNGGGSWATWYPDWPRFNAQSPGGAHTNTNQLAYYATSKVQVAGGALRLLADQQQTVAGLPYTAGMISSKNLLEQQYGWFEARLRIVGTRHSRHWPAWWMFNSVFNQWPPEIDIWELFGTANEYLTNLYRVGSNDIGHNAFSDFANFHTYGVRWNSTNVTFFRDGVQTYQSPAPSVSGPQFLVLNNGVEAPGSGTVTGTMPVVEVDYVRAWSL